MLGSQEYFGEVGGMCLKIYEYPSTPNNILFLSIYYGLVYRESGLVVAKTSATPNTSNKVELFERPLLLRTTSPFCCGLNLDGSGDFYAYNLVVPDFSEQKPLLALGSNPNLNALYQAALVVPAGHNKLFIYSYEGGVNPFHHTDDYLYTPDYLLD